jgi:hypothetical protein
MMLARFTAPPLLRLLFIGLILVNISMDASILVSREGLFSTATDLPVANDFVAFYAAGRIIAAGDGEQLYDVERLQAEEAQFLGRDGLYYPFAYPAYVAAPFVLLGLLPFWWALAVFIAAMAIMTVIGVALLRPVSGIVSAHFGLVVLALMGYLPLHGTTFTGQNAAVSFLFFAGAYAAFMKRRHVLGGAWLGLMLFKPQMALPLLLLLVWRRDWRAIGAAGLVGGGLALVGVAVAGPMWLRSMVDLVGSHYYLRNETSCCGAGHVSLSGVIDWTFGGGGNFGRAVVVVLSALVVGAILTAWRRASIGGPEFPLRYAVALAATLFLSPHALAYDTTMLAIAVVILLDHWRHSALVNSGRVAITERQRLLVLLVYGLGWVWRFAPALGFQPAFFVPIALGAAAWFALRSSTRLLPYPGIGTHLGAAGAAAD